MLDITSKIGVLCDTHGSRKHLEDYKEAFDEYSVDAVVLNGDMDSGDEDDFSAIIDTVKELIDGNYDLLANPGSHDSKEAYLSTVDIAEQEWDNFFDLQKNRGFELDEVNLASVPGSEVEAVDNIFEMSAETINETIEYLSDSKENILVSHDPPYGVVDRADFGELKEDYRTGNKLLEAGTRFPLEAAVKVKSRGAPVEIFHETHVGSKVLRKFVDQNEISFGTSGHIHEDGQKGENINGERVEEGDWSECLFYNPGPAEEGYAGVIELKISEDARAKYKNVDYS